MTHSRRGDVKTIPPVIFHHLIDAIIVSYVERGVLPRCIEISSVRDWASSGITTGQQRGAAVIDDPESRGGSDRCVVCFDDPRLVPLHTNGGIVTNPSFHSVCIWHRHVRVYRETTGRCETGIEPDEDRFDRRPSLIVNRTRVEDRAGVEAMGNTIVPPFYCVTRVGREECEGPENNSLR